MKRTVKRFFIFLGLLAAFTVFKFPYEIYSSDLERYALEQASLAKVRVEFDQLTLHSPRRLSIQGIGGLITGTQFPIPFALGQTTIFHRYLPYLWLTSKLDGTARAYEGEVDFKLRRGIFSDEIATSLNGAELQVETYPLAQAYGGKGSLNFSLELQLIEQERGRVLPKEGALNLTLSEGEIAGGHKVLGLVPLPNVQAITLSADATIEDQKIKLSNLNLQSSHGNAQGSGDLTLSKQGRLEELSLPISISLTRAGVDDLGGYLALAAGNSSLSSVKEWSVQLSKSRGRPVRAKIYPAR